MTEILLQDFVKRITDRDIASEFDEFPTRLAFQKAMYLAQESGIVRSPKYTFNLYVYGPYSPEWAAVGFGVASGSSVSIEVDDDLSAMECLTQSKDSGWLSAVATLHWYVVRLGLDREGAYEKALIDEKYPVLDHFDQAWDLLQSVGWLRTEQ